MEIRISFGYLCLSISILIGCAPNDVKNDKSRIDVLVESKILSANALVDSTYNYSAAKEILEPVLDMDQFHTVSDSIRSLSYHRLGSYSYQMDLIEDAIIYLDSSISIRTANHKTLPSATANSHYIRSLAYEKALNFTEAIANINQAISLIKNYNSSPDTLITYYLSAAKYYVQTSDFAKAEQYYDFISQNIEKGSEEYVYYTLDKALMYSYVGQYDESKTYYEEAIKLLVSMPSLKDNLLTARLRLLDLSVLDMEFNEMLKSYKDFEKSFEANSNHQRFAKLYLFHNMAYEYLYKGHTEKSRENYLHALSVARQLTTSKHSVDIAEVFEGLGDVDAAENKFDKSIQNYHNAIMTLCIGFQSSNPYDLPNINDHVILNMESLQRIMGFKADAIYKKYKSTGDLNDLKSTFKLYEKLDAILVKIRQGFQSSSSSYDYLEGVLLYYEKAVQVALELHNKTKDNSYLDNAYSFASKNKAVVLLDGIQNGKAMVAGVPLKVLNQEEKLQKEIYELDANINGLTINSQNTNRDLGTQINLRFEKIREYEELISQMEKDYPKYYDLKYAASKGIKASDIGNQLADSTAIIEYFVGVESIYSFIYSKDTELQVIVKEKPADFSDQCSEFRNMISNDSLQTLKSFEAVSYELYSLLLLDELQILSANEEIKSLIIIPDDHLFRISFDPLLTSPLPDNPELEWTNELPYLIRKYAISYAYSNKLIFNSNDKISKRKKYLGFGLEYDDYTLKAFEQLNKNSRQERSTRRIGKLVYSDDEVLESAKIFDGKHFINKKATKSKFLKEAPKANLLHLVTHGFVHQKDPLNSGLVFTKENNNDDFILRAGQLYTMTLDAEMAVLSACHSGYGNLQKGEGIRSLARAFNYAGCPNVTASLWAAPDLSTKDIIIPFYKHIKAGKSINGALQLSKLDYLDKCMFNKEALPCNWAHMVSIGDVRPLY